MRRNSCLAEAVPFSAMVVVESMSVGLNTLYKAAVSEGLSYHIFMTYSNAISALFVLPLALIFHRKQELPPFTVVVLGKFCLLGFVGFISQCFAYSGISYSDPTLAAALSNLTPATTFILAVLCRIEKVKFQSRSGQAKIIGTLVSIGGALVAVLYKGPILISAHHAKLHKYPNTNSADESNWLLGGALLSASFLLLSVWDTAQAKFATDYPAEFILVFFYNLSSCIISIPVGMFFEPHFRAWKLPVDVQLYSVLYSGIIGSGVATVVRTWGLRLKGPVYVGLFKPLSIAIAAILGVLFIGANLYLGSVIGSMIISVGFYMVIWGKMKDEIIDVSTDESLSYDSNAPLLTSYVVSIKK